RLAQDPNPPEHCDRNNAIDLFSDEKYQVENPDRIKEVDAREKIGARTKTQRKVQCAESLYEDARPERNFAANDDAGAAPGVTFFECGDCAGHMLFVDARIGVDEEQDLAGG